MAMEFWFLIRVFGPGVGTSSMHCSLNCPIFLGAFSVGSAVLDMFVCIPSCRL
jgi:hypothetical protein